MKRKHILLLFVVLLISYVVMCFQLLVLLDAKAHSGNVRGAGEREHNIFHEYLGSPCKCNGNAQLYHRKYSPSLTKIIMLDYSTCFLDEFKPPEANITMLKVVEDMPIRYPSFVWTDSGWIQEFELSYTSHQWTVNEPLTVFVVMHSHNDPGWLETYDGYFNKNTKMIITNIVHRLAADPELKFIWSEVTYLEKWYNTATEKQKESLYTLLENGQLEIVTGGSVMTDEAVAHYEAMLDQLIHGHLWLQHVLDYRPAYGWSIDPFGLSPTMAYFLQYSELSGMVIQRAHYAVKQHLGYQKKLEFKWKQAWEEEPGMLCHLMPFLSYNIPSSCGPDIQKCCQFDFHKKKCWRWGKYVDAENITDANIRQKSEDLLDQYRKKSQLFQHNTLLVPHGDDFRYTQDVEFSKQTENLKKLFNYMNAQEDWNVKVKFGTITDYMTSVQDHFYDHPSDHLPTLSGDFFPYNDRADQYWTGYYTTRPILKARIRELSSCLRSAEILFSVLRGFAVQKQLEAYRKLITDWSVQIQDARTTHGIMSHHDAITGTAKNKVTSDYLNRIFQTLKKLSKIITHITSILLTRDNMDDALMMISSYHSIKNFPTQHVLTIDREELSTIVVFNQLSQDSVRAISITASTLDVGIFDHHQNPIPCQLNPIWRGNQIDRSKYQVVFLAEFSALSFRQFTLKASSEHACKKASIKLMNIHNHEEKSPFHIVESDWKDFNITNPFMNAYFCKCTGLLQTVENSVDYLRYDTAISFVKYGTGQSWATNPFTMNDKSGAYIFLPDGPAKPIQYSHPKITIVEGVIQTSVTTQLPLVIQTATLYNTTDNLGSAMHLDTLVNITDTQNQEIAMRINTDIENLNLEFFTDQNGFQIVKRRTQPRLPIQGNYYPMTTQMYIEDDLFRVNILSSESHGVTSLKQGELEVMLDRRTLQDDWRGLGESITDNAPVYSHMRLLCERRKTAKTQTQQDKDYSSTVGFPSLLSQLLLQDLQHPPIAMYKSSNIPMSTSTYELVHADAIPCDMILLNLRAIIIPKHSPVNVSSKDLLEDNPVLMLFHRIGVDCQFADVYHTCQVNEGRIQWTTIFTQLAIKDLVEMSLTGTQPINKPHHSYIQVPTMHINTYNIDLR